MSRAHSRHPFSEAELQRISLVRRGSGRSRDRRAQARRKSAIRLRPRPRTTRAAPLHAARSRRVRRRSTRPRRAARRHQAARTGALMKIALISPKGPLYRHRGGIFRKSLRYQPLTLTTLAALVPPDLNAELALYDEGIQDVPQDLDADLIGMTVITGTARRTYELARAYRGRGRAV